MGMTSILPSNRPALRLAVLIDAENISAKIAAKLFDEIATLGEASIRRIYGDFSNPKLKPWIDILARHAILPHQNFSHVSGKNASDMALVIDAMDLLHRGGLDGFCLVSSDSDFTRLAARIREAGIDVYGFGEQKTPESLRQACKRFIYTENLLPDPAREEGQARNDAAPAAHPKKPVSAAIPLLRKAITQLGEMEDDWAHLGAVGQRLNALHSDFDTRSFGHAKLVDLIGATAFFDIDRRNNAIYVRRKPKAG